MPTSDPLDKRDYDRVVTRHADRLLYLVKHIQECAGCVRRDVEAGKPSLSSHSLQMIRSDAIEALEKLAALDALKELEFLVTAENSAEQENS